MRKAAVTCGYFSTGLSDSGKSAVVAPSPKHGTSTGDHGVALVFWRLVERREGPTMVERKTDRIYALPKPAAAHIAASRVGTAVAAGTMLFVPTSFISSTNRFDEGVGPEEPICD